MAELNLTREGITLVPAGKRHAALLGRAMRKADREEIFASGGWRPEACVRANINRSVEAWAVYAGDDLLCVFGVVLKNGHQLPWLFGSDAIERHALTFWRCSKIAVGYLRGKYPFLINMVHAKYTGALRWVERLGFEIHQPEPFGALGDLFCPVVLKTKEVKIYV